MQTLTVFLAVLISTAAQSALADGKPTTYEPVSLCTALASVRPGESLPVTVRGVYEVYFEGSVFFDPAEAQCDLDLQPATWVEFDLAAERPAELDALLKVSGRATVTFEGLLYGPGPLLPHDPSLPFAAAFGNRVSHRRYGHLSSFRTKLVVEAVLQVGPVAADVPWVSGGRAKPVVTVASPQRFDVPQYPEAARQQGITGDVVVAVTVRAGRVTAAEVGSGDRALANEAVANIRTWQFDDGTDTSFRTRFTYKIERRKAGDQAPRIELHLPESVTITAASFDW